MHLFLLLGAVIWHVARTEAAVLQNTKFTPLVHDIIDSLDTFTPNYFKAVAEVTNGDLVCSAPTALMVLSMAVLGAQGKTKQQLQTASAFFQDKALAAIAFRNYISTLKDYRHAGLKLANKVFVRQDLLPYERYTTTIKVAFGSSVQAVNFEDPYEANRTINEWFSSQTNNHINNVIKPEDVDRATDVVFANTVYFRGIWANQFDIRDTSSRFLFSVNPYTKRNVSTMYKYGFFKTGRFEDLSATFIEIPYNKSMSMVEAPRMYIVLPDKVDGLTELEKNVDKLTVERLASGKILNLYLLLPKFKIESTIPVDKVVTKMGVTDILSSKAVDLTDITHYPNIKNVKFIHKVVIEIDEGASKPDPPPYAEMVLSKINVFHVDRPFLGFIASPSSSVIFFSFRYTGPPEAEA
ncbi:antichymotrypsin-2-like [Venturia canescens]|uniref:antichymotrypsin-2-like n=1 Tax=Venturia canescens TaxID=32260 RepID=UPI001C9D6598|nr:antichymotrypsin-2-like [Venturia canescens]